MFRKTLESSVALALLFTVLVSGTGLAAAEEQLLFPFAEPSICLYLNVSRLSEHLSLHGAESSLVESARRVYGLFSSLINRLRNGDGSDASVISDQRQRSFLKSLGGISGAGGQSLSEIHFFYDRPESWILFLSGNFTPEGIRDLFNDEMIHERLGGFSVRVSHESALSINVGPGFLFVCPAAIEGNLIFGLYVSASSIKSKYSAFLQMLRLKPALAIELDLARMLELSREHLGTAPESVQPVHLVRLVLDSRVIRGQLYIPDDHYREAFHQQVSGLLPAVAASILEAFRVGESEIGSWPEDLKSAVGSLSSKVSGTSIFIEGKGLGSGVKVVEAAALAAVSSLLSARNDHANPVTTAQKAGSDADAMSEPATNHRP